MDSMSERKIIARRRIRGLLIFLIVILSLVLIWDVYLLIKGLF
jgi:hypothetical protein